MTLVWFAAGLLVGWTGGVILMALLHGRACGHEQGHDWLDYSGRAPKVGR